MSMELYRKRYITWALGVVLFSVLATLSGDAKLTYAQLEREEPSQPVRMLLVDETQTLQASLLVNLLAATLQRTGLFEIEAQFVDVPSSFDDPLGINPSERRYELILIIPREQELEAIRQLWIATCPLTHQTRPELLQGVQTIQRLIEEGSQGQLRAVSVNDDAIPGYFATLFMKHGWLECD